MHSVIICFVSYRCYNCDIAKASKEKQITVAVLLFTAKKGKGRKKCQTGDLSSPPFPFVPLSPWRSEGLIEGQQREEDGKWHLHPLLPLQPASAQSV